MHVVQYATRLDHFVDNDIPVVDNDNAYGMKQS